MSQFWSQQSSQQEIPHSNQHESLQEMKHFKLSKETTKNLLQSLLLNQQKILLFSQPLGLASLPIQQGILLLRKLWNQQKRLHELQHTNHHNSVQEMEQSNPTTEPINDPKRTYF